MQPHPERHAPSSAQIKKARALLNEVPAASYDWTGDAGTRFLDYVQELAGAGVPTAWLAEYVGLNPTRLYVVLNRRKVRRASKRAVAS